MIVSFDSLLNVSSPYIPHGHCYLWQPSLISFHVISDLLIGIAYYSIPITLAYFVRQRKDVPFNRIFLLFAAFIIACGTTHLAEIWTLWFPTYWISGLLKAITAFISIYTAIILIYLIPKALRLPSPAQLEAVNEKLQQQIEQREKAEKALHSVVEGTASVVAEDFFPALVRHLTAALNVRYAFIAENTDDSVQRLRTLAFCKNAELQDNFDYDLVGTPCEMVTQKQCLCHYPINLKELFPNSLAVTCLKAESYLGVPLFDNHNQIVGNLCILHDEPFYDEAGAKAIMQIFAARASAELQRKRANDAVRKAQQDLEKRVEERTSDLLIANDTLTTEIEERQRIEERLRLFESAVIHANDAILITEAEPIDEPGPRIVYVNQAFCRMTGYSPEDVMGKTPRILQGKESDRGELDKLRAALQKWQAVRVELLNYRKDGTPFWVELNIVPIANEMGWYTHWMSVQRDVTERKQAEQRRERERQQLQQIIHNAPVAMAMFDTQMRYQAYSNQWLRDYQLEGETLIARYHSEVLPALAQKHQAVYSQALQGQILSATEDVLTLPDGSKFYFRWAVQPWYTTEEDIGGIVVVTQSINELVKARESALEASRMKSQFLATMSHEIRTPMNGVIGMTDLLLQTSLNPQQRDYVMTLKSSAQNLLLIINDILDFSKLEAGEMRLEKIEFNLNHCVEEVTDLLNLQAQEKGLELLSVVDSDIPWTLKGDPNRLRQVLVNLAGNAIKFTDSGKVVIEVDLVSETANAVTLEVKVRDTGIGISPANQKKLFQSFSQVDSSTTRQYGGTGLGLVICQQLVELMGGEIGVNSEYGVGSTFRFTAQFDKLSASSSSSEKRSPHVLTGLKLLVVDDQGTTSRMIRHYTRAWGIEWHEVSHIQPAYLTLLEAAKNEAPYTVVLINLQSPTLKGDLLGQLISFDPILSSTKWVVTVSLQQHNQVKALLSQGACDYLLHPLKPSRLFDCLARIQGDRSLVAPQPPSASQQALLGSLKVLVVEDTPINQKVLCQQLEMLGCQQVACAANGQEALDRLRKETYDLVLMDCLMPVLDGYKATAAIRQREGNTRHTIIIAMTANAMKGEREKCLAVGMDDYISKPVEMEALNAVVTNWASQCFPEPRKTDAQSDSSDESILSKEKTTPIDWERLHELSQGDSAFELELIQDFMTDAPTYVEGIKHSLINDDYEKLARQAHQLKGAASMVFIRELPAIAAQLEHQAQAKELDQAMALLNRIETLLDHLYDFLQETNKSV
ncbi:MAG: response regulator [Chroococcales cyanobacterium]